MPMNSLVDHRLLHKYAANGSPPLSPRCIGRAIPVGFARAPYGGLRAVVRIRLAKIVTRKPRGDWRGLFLVEMGLNFRFSG